MSNTEGLLAFKVFIKVIKSLSGENSHQYFGEQVLIREPVVYAKDKAAVDQFILEKYPQFFPTGKVYKRESKDTAQFFYALVYPLYDYELKEIAEGEWICDGCGQVHENTYVSRPQFYNHFSRTHRFCRGDNNDYCLNLYKKNHMSESMLSDNMSYVRADSPHYIYRITEKSTGKCYVGKTRNEPFFRWWDHLKRSSSPFGKYLRTTKISDWTFEVLDILEWNVPDSEVLHIESQYMVQYNSLENGFNAVISSKRAKNTELSL